MLKWCAKKFGVYRSWQHSDDDFDPENLMTGIVIDIYTSVLFKRSLYLRVDDPYTEDAYLNKIIKEISSLHEKL